jgi:2',3'-cyclic-nucleotide 2'-phosphodiesterase (5'-nucleotidase family)
MARRLFSACPLTAAALVLMLAATGTGCQSPATGPVPGPATSAVAAGSGAAAVAPDGPILNITDSVLTMQVAIARAVSTARNASVDTMASAVEGSGQIEATDVTGLELVFVSNAHGELEDCGCPRHPLGGLARRATIWDGIDSAPGAALHFDAGNSLFRDLPQPGGNGPSDEQLERAGVIARAFGAMETQFLAVGPRDLTAGAATLKQLSQTGGVELLATNLEYEGGPLGQTTVVAESGGVRVGFVSVLRRDSHDAAFWQQTGVNATDEVAALTTAIASLRAAEVALVVLVDTAGGEGLEQLTASLAQSGALPDLIVMSGNGMSTHEPRLVSGIPALESGSRGKQVAHLTLALAEGQPVSFATEARAYAMMVESVQNTSRVLGQSEERLARTRARGEDDPVAENVLLAMRQQRAELPRLYAMLLEQRDRAGSGLAAAASRLGVELVNVELEIEERADIRDMVVAVMGE